MQTTFDTIHDACLYYESEFNPGAAFATQPIVHGIRLDFHVYVFDTLTINGIYPSTLFSLCKSEDCATQVIICQNLRIDTGYTLTPPYRCKGLIIHCADTFYNNRGYVRMTSRGCKAAGQDLYMFYNYDYNKYETVPATGAAGGDGHWNPSNGACISGNNGYSGINRQSGGGGSGASRDWMGGVSVGRGGYGTSYSGGVGSGSAQSDGGWGGSHHSANAPDNGGPGGYPDAGCGNYSGFRIIALGGQGNPACYSAVAFVPCGNVWSSRYGTGGLIIIYAGDFNNNGYIQSLGGNMMTCSSGSGWTTTGGASGGGSININYCVLSNKGSVSASGGRITSGGCVNGWGGYGGAGCITYTQMLSLKLIRCTSNYGNKVPKPGNTVTITTDYVNDPLGVFTGFSFSNLNESDVTYLDDSKLSFTFVMPNKSVTITANYRLYKIYTTRCSHNAPKIPIPGDKYIITAPSSYIMNTSLYNTERFQIFSYSGIKEAIRIIDRLTFEFTMPVGDVNVAALFTDTVRKNTDIYKQINEQNFIVDYYNLIH